MLKSGIEITCSGCGIRTFIERPPQEFYVMNHTDGSKVTSYNENQSESWVREVHTMDLCPRCQKIREQMLCEFYEKCGEARDDENYIIPGR